MRRMPLAMLATAVGVLGAASAAHAAGPVQDGQFNLEFNTGKIVISDLASTDIPSGSAVKVLGNVDPTGKVALPKTALQFPPLPIDVSGFSLAVSIAQSNRSDGSIDPATGAVTLPLAVTITIDGGAVGFCKIPLNLSFGTGTQSVTASKNVVGSPYNPSTGAVTLAGVAPIPTLADLSATDCPLKDLLGAFIPPGANGNVGLELVGLLDMPGGAKYPDDAGTVPPPPEPTVTTPVTPTLANPVATLAGTTLKSTKGSVAVPIKCAGAVATNKACAGKATLTTKVTTITTKKVKGKKKKIKKTKTVTLGSASYNAAAGATATPKIKLSKANQKLLKAAKNKLKAVINVTTTGGTGVTNKSVTIKG